MLERGGKCNCLCTSKTLSIVLHPIDPVKLVGFFFHLLLNIATDLLLFCQNGNWCDGGLQEMFPRFTCHPVCLCYSSRIEIAC